MFYLISGGSGSGKSEFAENLSVKLRRNEKELIYIATMMAFDEESKKRIKRHRDMRKDKNFKTIECFTNLKKLSVPNDCTVLLDCMSNLVANEMFSEEGAKERVVEQVIEGIFNINSLCNHLVVVTNELFSDGMKYDEMTEEYLKNMGQIHQILAKEAQAVVEVVCGIPIIYKGEAYL